MSFDSHRNRIWIGAVSLLLISSLAIAQNPFRNGPDDLETARAVEDEIPRGLLLTERGRALAEELKQLRRSEASMGPRHPLLAEVRKQIDAVKEQIEAWSPRVQQFSGDGETPLPEALPDMNDQDLRQLILRMAAKISQLERRVEKLEERLDVH